MAVSLLLSSVICWIILPNSCVYSCLQNGDALLILSGHNSYDINKIFYVNKQDKVRL